MTSGGPWKTKGELKRAKDRIHQLEARVRELEGALGKAAKERARAEDTRVAGHVAKERARAEW